MNKIIVVIVLLLLAGGGYYYYTTMLQDTKSMDYKEKVMMEEEQTTMKKDRYTLSGTLTDVSGGTASGTVQAGYTDGVYNLRAEFADLPEVEPGYFYEGWIVRPEPMSVISTGGLVSDGNILVNEYTSSVDMTDHIKYVLTLEPDDGDPAPAEHVLDGMME